MRILERIEQIYAIGDGPGANRVGGSEGEEHAHDLAAAWFREAGLEVEVDPDGNLLGRRPGTAPGAGELWIGSHLDSVPNGGRFDGVLGVLAGLEALERIGAAPRPLAVVAFRDEERGFGGSLARVRRGPLPELYLEAHVEQGPVLERAGAPLGVVGGIVGVARGEIIVHGEAGHAGTTPMDGRRDALSAAAATILRIRDAAVAVPAAVATVGELEVSPGAANVIPERVRLSVDARAPDRERLDALVAAIGFEPTLFAEPAPMDTEIQRVLRDELERRGLPVHELISGAGHDAGVLAAAGVRCGMLFVRSGAGGVSHSPDEWTAPEDVALCVDVLTAALERLAALELESE
jgi:acetylornithine deacetylase/succinyl-diaminopimelate desuccinylase-like protein